MSDNYGLGYRIDGTAKGPGFAAVTLPDGTAMTEVSFGPVDQLYPGVYQGIPPWELQTLADLMMYGYYGREDEVNAVQQHAYEASLLRASQGLPPWWIPADGPPGLDMMDFMGRSVQAYPRDAWGNFIGW